MQTPLVLPCKVCSDNRAILARFAVHSANEYQQRQVRILTTLVAGDITTNQAAISLGVTVRTFTDIPK